MCGIFGWSFGRRAKLPQAKRETLASVLAIANSLRGDHSWGAYSVRGDGQTKLRREVGDIAKASGIAALGAFPLVMAHTRFATTGAITVENQHPFKVGKILLAHNGVIHNHDELCEKHDRKCEVDSMHLAHHLDAGLPFKDIEGYGAIEWIEDPHSRIVNLCRMVSGSLTVFGIRNEKHKTVGLAWSSDRAHLESAIGAARLDGFPYETLEEGQRYQAIDGRFLILEKAPLLELAPWLSTTYTRNWRRKWVWDAEKHEGHYENDQHDTTCWCSDCNRGATTQVDEGLWVDEHGRLIDPRDDEEEALWRLGAGDKEEQCPIKRDGMPCTFPRWHTGRCHFMEEVCPLGRCTLSKDHSGECNDRTSPKIHGMTEEQFRRWEEEVREHNAKVTDSDAKGQVKEAGRVSKEAREAFEDALREERLAKIKERAKLRVVGP